MKNHKLAIFIAVVLFIAPFFWLKPGEMNLGGDAGRLYFYDPSSFIKNYALYNFISSGKGSESGGFVFFPFTFTLYLLKLIFTSPTSLIAIFNGIILSASFLSIYFIVRELLEAEKSFLKKKFVAFSSIIAGLFYIFSQELMNAGWETPILTHNQIFLNPLIFLLIFKYILTRNSFYIVGACVLSVIFSTNFSYIGSPTFFAFYPLSLVFLWSYIKFVRKMTIPYKGLAIGLVLFVCLHAFHLIPEVLDVFSSDSANNKTVFLVEGVTSRGGLDYFIAVAASTRVSLAWLGLEQFQNDPKYIIYILLPFVLLGGFFFNKGKTLLVTGIFFLIALFFSTANITDIGFTFYKLLFKIPGFSMFRNFHGQWLYVFIFFYSLLIGQAVSVIVQHLSKNISRFFIFVFIAFILITGIPLLNGSIPIPRHKDSGLRFAFRMDPVYEEVLDYFKKSPTDSKILSLPLTGPSYQVLQGADRNGSLYMGLPIISYLVGKSDFAGFGSLDPYSDLFLNYIKKRNFVGIERIFSIMNIHQVFYNSDPFIYSKPLQGYLYAHVSKYNPKTQNQYKSFIENLSKSNPLNFGDKYHIYTINPDKLLPHIFTTTDLVYTNNQLAFTTGAYLDLDTDLRTVPVSVGDEIKENNILLFGSPQTFLSELKNNSHFHVNDPFVNYSLNSPFYMIVPIKEKFDLFRAKNHPDDYLNLSLLIQTKRISEMLKSEEKMHILKKPWTEPKLWGINRWSTYNNWEASFTRYQKGMEELINWVANNNEPMAVKGAQRIKINEQLFHHQVIFYKFLKNLNKDNDEKKYIHSLANNMFDKLFQKVQVPTYDSSQYYYELLNYPGEYNVYLDTKNIDGNLKNASIAIVDKSLNPIGILDEKSVGKRLLQFDNYSFKNNADTSFSLTIPPKNLANNSTWDNSGSVSEKDKVISVILNNKIGENTKGLMLDIPGWTENNTYLISFDYLTEGNDFIFSLYDKKETIDLIRKYDYKLFFEKILSSTVWKSHQSIITAENRSESAFIVISGFTNEDKGRISIKNLSISKIQYPNVIFKKISNTNATKQNPPLITFTKINPTKYSVRVEGAKNLYALVFLESFNNNWNLVDPSREKKSIIGSVLQISGTLGKNMVGMFVKENLESKDGMASYFNGQVKEGIHRNTFLSSSTFETWGKSAIAENRHSQAFGYANAWLVNTEDMQGRSDYTLIIEMKNHKRFYIFGFVSTITLVMIVIFCVKKVFFNHAKNNK